jgi:hypothetical protein
MKLFGRRMSDGISAGGVISSILDSFVEDNDIGSGVIDVDRNDRDGIEWQQIKSCDVFVLKDCSGAGSIRRFWRSARP